ncbi:hypothetical protein EYW49_20510 [Siculibacillus lacustris]|uniref:Uncharacterized protein n=1 Tax=Siculibacillus lacustris TaxID=1549641 RepID=A0A4Q9VEU2_9HYPH|nr:hypothetical protein [Siculibacillus lacustris]TBW33344.1 hypothetical protein EYW49_20510 [Siculibacillus lacustris]
MDISAYNTAHFQLSLDVTPWAAAYGLDAAAWRLQVRPDAASANLVLDMNTANGRATYSTGVVVFSAPQSVISPLVAGSYVWDFGFTASGGDFIRCDGGMLTLRQGVTR